METYQGQLHSSQEQIDLMHKMIGQLLAKTRSPSSMEETAANGMEQQQWEQKIVLLEAQIEHLKVWLALLSLVSRKKMKTTKQLPIKQIMMLFIRIRSNMNN